MAMTALIEEYEMQRQLINLIISEQFHKYLLSKYTYISELETFEGIQRRI